MPQSFGRQEEDDGIREPGGFLIVFLLILGTVLSISGIIQIVKWIKEFL